VAIDSPFFATVGAVFTSLLVVGLSEVLPDRRLAVLAAIMMVVACGIVCCKVVTV
jgi:hypothetical protein